MSAVVIVESFDRYERKMVEPAEPLPSLLTVALSEKGAPLRGLALLTVGVPTTRSGTGVGGLLPFASPSRVVTGAGAGVEVIGAGPTRWAAALLVMAEQPKLLQATIQ